MKGKSRFIKALTSMLLAMAMIIMIVPAMPSSAATYNISSSSFTFTDVNGKQQGFLGGDGKAKVIIIGGIANDVDTNSVIKNISYLCDNFNAMDGVSIYAFNWGGGSQDDIKSWMSANSINSKMIVTHQDKSNDNAKYRNMKEAITSAVGGGNPTRPLVGYIDASGNVAAASQDGQSINQIAANLKTIGVNVDVSSATVSLKVEGTANFDAAYKIYEAVNKNRGTKSLSPLKMDKDLIDAAAQRAAEIAVYYDNNGIRPDGTANKTISSKIAEENTTYFACSGWTAQQIADFAMTIWSASEAHNNRIVGSYKSTGVAVFVQNGYAYCVQEFGTNTATATRQPATGIKSYTVKTSVSNLKLEAKKREVYVLAGSTTKLSVINNQSERGLKVEIAPSSLRWTAENVGTIIESPNNGEVKGLSEGMAYVTASITSSDGIKKEVDFLVRVVNELPDSDFDTYDDNSGMGWINSNGKSYWYEGGKKQGTVNDPKGVIGDGTNRGREIYDPVTNGWYWLDSCYDGAKAKSKEVWIPYIYNNEKDWGEAEIKANAANSGSQAAQVEWCIKNKRGKWVRYDAKGAMIKGWYTVDGDDISIYPDQAGNTYYYDYMTGLMATGTVTIDGIEYTFDEKTGVLK